MKNLYSELFLEDLNKIKKSSVIFLPLGTLEWHGAHLPLGTDLIVGLEFSKRIVEKVGGLILPPLYVGTARSKIKKGIILSGVDLWLNKTLKGSIYFLKPLLFYRVLEGLIRQIKIQGFKKLVIVTGHAGSKQEGVLDKIKKTLSKPNFKILVINPYQTMRELYGARHAGWEETSLLWALRPDLIKKSKKTRYSNKDMIALVGEDPRVKASKNFGNKMLKNIMKSSIKLIQNK